MLDDLQALVELAESGSVNKAAGRLRRTPSAVTRKLQRLEIALGAQLLDRSVKPPRLTPLGRRVVEDARELLRRLEDLRANTQADAEPRGTLRLGVSHALADGNLVEPVRKLIGRYPLVNLRLTTDLTSDLFAQLQQGNLDAAVALLPAGSDPPPSLESRVLAGDAMLVVGIADSMPTGRVSLQEFADRQWVLNPPGCLLRASLLDTLARAGTPATIGAEMHNFHLQLEFVAAGHGLGFVPSRFLRQSPHSRRLRGCQLPDSQIKMSVVFVQSGYLGALQAGVAFLESELKRQFEIQAPRPTSE